MKELRVIERENIWCVEHLEGGQPDPEIVDLFYGEHVLPTPFMTSIPLRQVLEKIRSLNPEHLVTFLDFRGKPVAAKWYCQVYSTNTHEQWLPAGFCPKCGGGVARCVACQGIIHECVTPELRERIRNNLARFYGPGERD